MFVTIRCSDDISSNDTDSFTIPEGKGAVQLSFDNVIGRTILPGDVTAVSDFDTFNFAFTATGGGTSYTKSNIPYANLNDPIVLDPGTYTLTVIAYYDDNSSKHGGDGLTPNSVAMAKNDPAVSVTITAAETTTATIVLKPYDQATGTGNGTFQYKITSDITTAKLTSAYMKFTQISNGAAQSDIDLKATAWNVATAQTLPLKAGDYFVDFLITVPTGEVINFRHIVHIYQNMTSSYDFTINRDYFNAVFKLVSGNITLEIPENNPEVEYSINGDPAVTYTSGATISLTRGDEIEFTVTNAGDYTSFEWYCIDTSDIGSGSTCTIDTTATTPPATANPYSTAKDYYLTVVGELTADSKKYATIIVFSVTP